MDRIMPIDLDQIKLRKSLYGYNTEEVDELLKVCARTIEKAMIDRHVMELEHGRMKTELESLRSKEELIGETLLLAQRTAEEAHSVARGAAENILEAARQSAREQRASAQRELDELRWDIDRLKADRRRFEQEFRLLLERQLGALSVEPILGLNVA